MLRTMVRTQARALLSPNLPIPRKRAQTGLLDNVLGVGLIAGDPSGQRISICQMRNHLCESSAVTFTTQTLLHWLKLGALLEEWQHVKTRNVCFEVHGHMRGHSYETRMTASLFPGGLKLPGLHRAPTWGASLTPPYRDLASVLMVR